jgi:iron-sulfur cluster assembly protein
MAWLLLSEGDAYTQKACPMIQLTESAANAVRTAIARANAPVEGLRIAVDAGGCAGYKYLMGLVSEPDPDDIVVESDGVKVFVDRDSVAHIEGTTVDFVSGLQSSGFTFDNPKAKSSCSCGKSFG